MYNQDLINAVERLKRDRIVKRDKDIVDKTGYSKGLVSNYLSGSIKASETFLQKFQEVYKVNINDTDKPNHSELINYNFLIKRNRIATVLLPKDAKKVDIDIIITHLENMKEAME